MSNNHDDHVHEVAQNQSLVYVSAFMLVIGIALDQWWQPTFFEGVVRLLWYVIAYLAVGAPVIRNAGHEIGHRSIFNEFLLMTVATLGAFAIGEYPEGVAVMLFYAVGEMFQESAVKRAKGSIKELLDKRPTEIEVKRGDRYEKVSPEVVQVGEVIRVLVGQQVPLDGELLTEKGSFNTSALTGESVPKEIYVSEKVFSGMLNESNVVEIRVGKLYKDSAMSRILDMVQNATSRKAKTELLIRQLAKIYTPIIFGLALAIVLIPWWFMADFVWRDWIYRALIFLVISCPCALVISIPLGYFGGIGAASKYGILFKGANFLDNFRQLKAIVMDKTGTLTKGTFEVRDIYVSEEAKNILGNESIFTQIVAELEQTSTHPIAKAIVKLKSDENLYALQNSQEVAGKGILGEFVINDVTHTIAAGNIALLDFLKVEFPAHLHDIVESLVLVAIDQKFAGYVTVADEIKSDAKTTIKELNSNGIQTVMLSGDRDLIVQKTATELGIMQGYGSLLPEDKVEKLRVIKANTSGLVAFVGDGINDAPVLAISDIGIAMGGMGSDLAIETADVVIQTDQPSKIVTAMEISKETRAIVMQNIALAFVVKVIVLILGAGGIATMWEAVFADVGVALLAILNAVRIMNKKF